MMARLGKEQPERGQQELDHGQRDAIGGPGNLLNRPFHETRDDWRPKIVGQDRSIQKSPRMKSTGLGEDGIPNRMNDVKENTEELESKELSKIQAFHNFNDIQKENPDIYAGKSNVNHVNDGQSRVNHVNDGQSRVNHVNDGQSRVNHVNDGQFRVNRVNDGQSRVNPVNDGQSRVNHGFEESDLDNPAASVHPEQDQKNCDTSSADDISPQEGDLSDPSKTDFKIEGHTGPDKTGIFPDSLPDKCIIAW